jgi:hypothetical protein
VSEAKRYRKPSAGPSEHGPGHGPGKGRGTHPEGCQCQRCIGFQKGNAVSTRHGGYSAIRVTERATEIMESLALDYHATLDHMGAGAVSIAWARVEVGARALDAVGDDPDAQLKALRLSEDLRGWVGTLTRVLDRLGGTPASKAEMAQRIASASKFLNLSPEERRELDELEAEAVGGDLLAIGDIRRRVRLRDLREQAAGG